MLTVSPLPITDRYTVSLAQHAGDLVAAQRLRYSVFNLELREGLPGSVANGLDVDEFDDVCDHLIVRERETDSVVGTYRMQTGETAVAHRGYYCDREFDLCPMESLRGSILELGRACIAREHRNQVVLGLLWKGIANHARRSGARYLIGCSSLSSQDESAGLALYRGLALRYLVTPAWRTRPKPGWTCTDDGVNRTAIALPRLMASYLALGARICGEPAIDREFRTIDFLTLLDLEEMPARVVHKFLR